MVDWFVVLTPVALLPVLWLLGFVGCGLDTKGEADAPVSVVEKTAKPVSLSWSNAVKDTTSIAFSCVVRELGQNGVPTGAALPGTALTQTAWPGSFLTQSGKAVAWVTVELPPSPQYQVEGTATVAWASASNPETLTHTKPFLGPLESQSWDFVLANGPQGWSLS